LSDTDDMLLRATPDLLLVAPVEHGRGADE
jgi:hypothetical protein